MTAPTIDFYFDFLSPFAYLARHRLSEIAQEHGARIAWHPVDLSALKAAAGNTGPGNRDMPVKLAYFKQDLARWAALYGVPLSWVGNYASRRMNIGALFARQYGREADYVRAAYHSGWGEGARLDDEAVLRAVALAAGLDANGLIAWTVSAEGDAAYEAETREAIARGVFGVPTMRLDGDMWWGNDRLFMLADTLRQRAGVTPGPG